MTMSPRVVLPPIHSSPAAAAPRRLVAGTLLAASRLLDRLAQRLAAVPAVVIAIDASASRYEFHAEAGAPEGALYVDGRLVAVVPGVTRL
jgi:hypothetical protein